ncbi:lactose-binding lectin l-2-like [Anguilla anguilla]|uniref:lactose-binding lectin l-2-like n=1 Tax=Anguilla anguilla TaxID=7936 RepID=UPI0015AA075D|nr:lactose-binding lectin l-2-like [Anguilla anguilla]
MASFKLPAFLCVAVLSSMALVSHGAVIGLCQGACPKGWAKHNSRCFLHVAEKKTWIDAELNCLHLGGNLASEHSEDDHQFLKELHKGLDSSDSPFWIGLSAVHEGRSWLWSDGTSASVEGDFSMWNSGEPNNAGGKEDCVHDNYGGYGGKYHWNDVVCDAEYASICVLRHPACVQQEIPPSDQPYVE